MSNPRIPSPPKTAHPLEPVALSGRLLAALRSASDRKSAGALISQLNGVEPESITGDDARIAFWLNLYNALLLHRLDIRPARGSMLRHPRVFSATTHRVGGHRYSLNEIEHGVLRRNRRAPMQLRRPFGDGDPRRGSSPTRLDPRIHFALNCGARSCPPIRSFEAADLDAELERATRSYLETETSIDRSGRVVTLPRLMRLYRSDFGSRSEQLEFASDYVPAIADLGAGSEAPAKVRYGRFDWTASDDR